MVWDGSNQTAAPTWDLVVEELKKARLRAREMELPLDFTLIQGEWGLMVTVGEGERSFVTFASGSFELLRLSFEYVRSGDELDPPFCFLYGGSYSEPDRLSG